MAEYHGTGNFLRFPPKERRFASAHAVCGPLRQGHFRHSTAVREISVHAISVKTDVLEVSGNYCESHSFLRKWLNLYF